MRIFSFLFGSDGRRKTPLSERVKHKAKGELEGRIIKNPLNVWWLVLFRNYLLAPLVKAPFIPVSEAAHIRTKLGSFSKALSIFINAGKKVDADHFYHYRNRRKLKISTPTAIVRAILALLWKPPGNPVLSERILCNKLLVATFVLWTAAMVGYALFTASLLDEGFRFIQADLRSLFFKKDFLWLLVYGKSLAVKIWIYSTVCWSVSMIASFLLTSRDWVKGSARAKASLQALGVFRPEEIREKTDLLALWEVVYISSPSASKAKLRAVESGWSGGFRPGEIIENSDSPSELLIIRRPEKEPIVFGGVYARSDIRSHLKAYQDKLLKKIKDAVKKPSDPELLFVGEVIDGRWWRSSQIYISMANNPHLVIVGQTRSGKTKTSLSFIYSFARVFPDTVWFFADGKGSPDYDPFADYLSEFPVAKPDDHGDQLIQLANVIEDVWQIYTQRKNLFNKAKENGKPCSSIYEYRKLVEHIPQVWLVIDEFAVFQAEMDFMTTWSTDGTIANRIKRLAAEAAAYGIHLLFASQRYQQSDFPTQMRSNLTTALIHNVQPSDAKFLGVEEATTLAPGQFFVRAAGLYCEHTGLSIIKAKLPYIGDHTFELIKETIKPIDANKKKPFDRQLLYNKGGNDIEKMGISEMTIRLERFFKDQHYVCTQLMEDLEATELQLEIVKGESVDVTHEDGRRVERLSPLKGARKIGVAILRPDSIDEDTFLGIQDKAESADYAAVIVYILGRSTNAAKLSFVKRLNERGSRFYIMPYREYYKDLRYIEMKRRVGEFEDVIRPKLERLGVGDLQHSVAGKNMDIEKIGKKTPLRIKIAKLLEIMGLGDHQADERTRDIPIIKTVLPGGSELMFLITASKLQKDDAKELAEELNEAGRSVIIVSEETFLKTDIKRMHAKGIVFWRGSHLDERLSSFRNSSKSARRQFLQDLMKSLNLIDPESRLVRLDPQTTIVISTEVDAAKDRVTRSEVVCGLTGHLLFVTKDYELARYTLNNLRIPASVEIVVKKGMAPIGANRDSVSIADGRQGDILNLGDESAFAVSAEGLLEKRRSALKNDPLLELMRRK